MQEYGNLVVLKKSDGPYIQKADECIVVSREFILEADPKWVSYYEDDHGGIRDITFRGTNAEVHYLVTGTTQYGYSCSLIQG